MKTSPPTRVLAILGALVISMIGMTPYEAAFAIRAAYSAVEANWAGWVLAVRNGSPPFRI
jgi:hypothetical protein